MKIPCKLAYFWSDAFLGLSAYSLGLLHRYGTSLKGIAPLRGKIILTVLADSVVHKHSSRIQLARRRMFIHPHHM